MNTVYDVVIIGAGPAGLSAGIYSGRALLDTVILERGAPGGQILMTDLIENYPGFPEGIAPFQLTENFRKQAERFGVKIEVDEAKEIQKKEILLHTIVHDLGGPLTAIRGALQAMPRDRIEAETRDLVELCLRQSRRQEAMIRSILETFAAEYSSLRTTTVAPGDAPSGRKTAAALLDAFLPAFSEAGLKLEMRFDAEEQDSLEVRIDATSLVRMLSNLLENALRHSPRGGRVTLTVGRGKDHILFAVEDEGPGVAEPERLFDRFGQGGEKAGKAGLGLYFCRITAEKWGGAIGHDNLPGRGSRFWFLLPGYG